ncbi:MAG: hypothetical protein ABSG59_08455 [Verrucomicrobiota bacterium]
MIALFCIIYGVLTGGLCVIELRMGNPPFEISDMQEFKNIQMVILGGAAVVYAVYRLSRFHPACNWTYAAWLRVSPWTSHKPLPLGPVHPVWQDAVVIGVLTAIAKWHAHVNPALPIIAFGLTYLVLMTILLAATRRWPWFLALGFLWPALMLPCVAGWPTIVLGVALVLVIWQGHRRSLQAFPWPFLSNTNRMNTAAGGRSGLNLEMRLDGLGSEPTYLGWPYLVLSPKFNRRSIPSSTSFFISVLAGWWTYCIIKSSDMESLPGLVLTFALVAALLRLMIYCSSVAPPFNMWGRIASGRIVLTGFDKVFLTPLAVVLIGVVGGMIIRRSGSWYPAVESCVIALLLFVLFTGGPALRNWILTAQLRFRPVPAYKTNNQMLRRV